MKFANIKSGYGQVSEGLSGPTGMFSSQLADIPAVLDPHLTLCLKEHAAALWKFEFEKAHDPPNSNAR